MNKFTKSICGIICALTGVLGSCQTSYTSPLKLKPSYVAIEANSGRVLYASNCNDPRPIGMLTNVACALVALDWAESRGVSMDTMLVVPEEVRRYPRTNLLHLVPGNTISLRDALHSVVMWDDSACAITIAHACGKTISLTDPIDSYVAQMNQLARAIGMTNTHFKACHGAVVSTASTRDMALLGTYAIQKPAFRSISGKLNYTANVNGREVNIRNTNRMVQLNAVDGVKAATSNTAGYCLIASSSRASYKMTDPKTGKPATYAQRLLVVLVGMHSSNLRYQAAFDMLNDGWGAWEKWIQSADYSEPNKFITLPH